MVKLLRMSWRRCRLVMAMLAILLVSLSITGCGKLSLLSEQSHTSQVSHPILDFVPRNALLTAVVDISVEPSRAWQRSGLTDSVSQSIDALLAPFAVDLNEEIRPWLGKDVAFAITDKDLDRDRHNGRQAGYLLVAATTDGERLREFLELFWQHQTIAGTQPHFTEVNGVPVISGVLTQDEHSIATAVVGGSTLLIANDIRVLRQSLRVSQIPTLHTSEPVCCSSGWVNLNMPEFVDWLGLAMPVELRFMSGFQWQQLMATVVFHPKGLKVNVQLTDSGGRQSVSSVPVMDITSPHNFPEQYLPESMTWAAVGYDLRSLWQIVWNELNLYQSLPSPFQQLKQWHSTQLAQILSEPFKQLFINDYAVGQLDDGSWLLAVTSAQSGLIDQLDSIAEQQGLTVSQLTLNDQPVTTWSRLKTQVSQETGNGEITVETDLVALHTKASEDHIFATSIDGLMSALEAPTNPLASTQGFQDAVQMVDMPNQGYMYGTWDKIDRLLASNRWFSLAKPILQPWSRSIDAISVTNYGQTANQLTGTVSIVLKK